MKPIESFEVPLPPKVNYINARYGLKSWLLTKDHKRIALLYLGSITFFFFIGGIYALMIRLELLTPQGDFLRAHMHALRAAIDKNFPTKLLHTIHGTGYRLSADPARP